MIDTCSHAITVLKYRSRVFPSIPSILCGIRDQQSSPYHHHGSWKCYQGLLKLSYHHPSEWDHVSTEVSVETTQVILLLETTMFFKPIRDVAYFICARILATASFIIVTHSTSPLTINPLAHFRPSD